MHFRMRLFSIFASAFAVVIFARVTWAQTPPPPAPMAAPETTESEAPATDPADPAPTASPTAADDTGASAAPDVDAESPEPTDTRTLLLVLAVKPTGGVTKDTTQLIDDIATVHLGSEQRFRVTSDSDVQAMLELEGSKASLGCDEASCLAELAGAMGAQYVVTGRLGQLGSKYLLTYTLFDSARGESVRRVNITETQLDAFADTIPPKLDELVAPLLDGESESDADSTPDNSASTADGPRPETGSNLPPPDAPPEQDGWSLNPWGILGSGALSLLGAGCCTTGFTIELFRMALAPYGGTDGILTVDDFWATGCTTIGCLACVGAGVLIPTTWIRFPEEEPEQDDDVPRAEGNAQDRARVEPEPGAGERS